MLDFVPMNPAAYESWSRVSIAGYARENVRSGRWTREEADSRSEQEFARLLPGGLSTADNYIFSMVDDQVPEPVGMIWFAVVRDEGGRRRAFVYDFEVFEAYRRRGYGIQALRLLEDHVRAMGLNTISLHVFAENRIARELYAKVGYRETNLYMSKELT